MRYVFTGGMWVVLVWISTHIYKSDVMWNLYYDVESWVWSIRHIIGG